MLGRSPWGRPFVVTRFSGFSSPRPAKAGHYEPTPCSLSTGQVIYEVRTDEVLVLAVAHLKRRPNYWKSRRG
jgi:hypothetical protein